MKLIVTADDFGLSEGINDGIVGASLNGIVTRTSLVANGPAFDHAVSLAREHENLRVGVHLTLVGAKPVSNPVRIQSIVRPHDTDFYANYKQFLVRYLLNRISLHDVRVEFEAQMEKVSSTGLNINHLDSHQHLHMLPGIFTIVVALARRYGIGKIRFPRCRITGSMSAKEALLTVLCGINRRSLAGTFEFTDCCFGLAESGNLRKSDLLRFMSHRNCGSAEVIAHPGHVDEGYRTRYGHWRYRPEQEYAALTDQEVKDSLRIKGGELIF